MTSWKKGSFELTNHCLWENMAIGGEFGFYNRKPLSIAAPRYIAKTRRANSVKIETDKIISRLMGVGV